MRDKSEIEFTEEVTVRREYTIQRIRDDYTAPWIGFIRESDQNSIDAYGENIEEEIIRESRDLRVHKEIDTAANKIIAWDNAGGMPKEVLKRNLMSIDNPSISKDEGKGAGMLGRGSWVIKSMGEWAEVEVVQDDTVLQTAVNDKGEYEPISEVEEPSIPGEGTGTRYRIHNVREGDMSELSDWDQVEEVYVENFGPVLNDANISFEYVIDDEMYTPEGPDLDELREKYALEVEEELDSFTYRGETHCVEDFVMIDATEMDEEPPWRGFLLFKGNDYLDSPFLKVDSYQPRSSVIPSMWEPVQMFGWCDASDVCRKRDDGQNLESNAHDEIQLLDRWDKMNIRSNVYEIHDEHFKTTQTTQQKKEQLSRVQERVNTVMSQTDDFDTLATASEDGPTGGENPTSTPSLSFLRCKKDAYQLEEGEEIQLSLEVNPEDNLAYNRYELYDISVKNTTTEDIVRQFRPIQFEPEENTPEIKTLGQFAFETSGKYVFSAKIRGSPIGVAEDELPSSEDTSRATFVVGDVEEPTGDTDGPESADGDGNSTEFVSELTPFQNPNAPRKAYVQPLKDGGLKVGVNASWPRVQQLNDEYRGEELAEKRNDLFVDWALEAVADFWLEKQLEEEQVGNDQVFEIVSECVDLRNELNKNKVTVNV